jgi:hypothetical protein
MGMTLDPIALATKFLAKMIFFGLDPSVGCLISSGLRAAKESFDLGRTHDLKTGERVQWFPCKTEHGTLFLFPAQINTFDVFSNPMQDGALSIPLRASGHEGNCLIIAPFHRKNMSLCKEL